MKRTKIYKASNVTFNPDTLDAYSYGWWRFVAVIDGLVVFNNYSYSNSTTRHQWKVRRLLAELGIKIDVEIPAPKGLTVDSKIDDLILQAEEHECDKFLGVVLRRQDAYQRRKALKQLEQTVEQTQVANI